MSFVRKDDFSIKMLIFNQALFSPFSEPKTHRMVMRLQFLHFVLVLIEFVLIGLYTASYRGLYSKFFSKKCVKCSSFENGELMLMVVQAHSEQQQQCFRLTLLDENELFYPIRIQFRIRFTNWSTNCVEGSFFSTKFSTVNFLQFGLKTHFGSKFSIFPNFIQAYSDPFRKCQTKN